MKRIEAKYIYDFILALYPKSYRQEFGAEMKYVFEESLKDAYDSKEYRRIAVFWIKIIQDATQSLTRQHIESYKGGNSMTTTNKDIIMQNKVFLWIALATAMILSLPLIAMQFTNEVDWKLLDFIIMSVLIYGTSSLFVLVARVVPRKYRVFIALGFGAFLFLAWAHLAVGIVDTWPLAGS